MFLLLLLLWLIPLSIARTFYCKCGVPLFFETFTLGAGFQEPAQGALADVLAQRHDELFGMVTLNAPSYCNFDWRLDVQACALATTQWIWRKWLILVWFSLWTSDLASAQSNATHSIIFETWGRAFKLKSLTWTKQPDIGDCQLCTDCTKVLFLLQVASRSVRQQASPRYLIALQTSEGVKHIEADYSILKEVCLQLEAALAESRTAHSRRFLRVLK